jgi:hypothetical protein
MIESGIKRLIAWRGMREHSGRALQEPEPQGSSALAQLDISIFSLTEYEEDIKAGILFRSLAEVRLA